MRSPRPVGDEVLGSKEELKKAPHCGADGRENLFGAVEER